MSVEKMRRQAERNRAADEEREHDAWIATHDHTWPMCSICLAKSLEPLNRMMARASGKSRQEWRP